MPLQNYNKKMLILEENGNNRKTLSEGYHYDSNSGKMTFDIKSNINGNVRETSGVLTNEDIENIFKRIPRFNGFQLPRRMINDFLMGHEDSAIDYNSSKQKYDMSNSDIYNLLDNMDVLHLNNKPKEKKGKKRKTKRNKKDEEETKDGSPKRKKKRKYTMKLPKFRF